MKPSKEISKIKDSIKTIVSPGLTIICKHCGKPIESTRLIGLSLICPLCGKPQNGHKKEPLQDPYRDRVILCKHCKKPIKYTSLIGFSLICPECGKPQNGQPHLKT